MRYRLNVARAALVAVLLVSCSPVDDGDSVAPLPGPLAPTTSTPVEDGPAQSLLYLDGRDLRSFDLTTGRDRLLGRAPSTDAVAAPDGRHIAYVASSSPAPDDEDFIAAPELRIGEVVSGNSSTVGPGYSPLWSPDGTRLAALVPADVRTCEGEACLGTVSAAMIDPVTGARTTVVEPGRMSLLGWWGDRLLVGLQDPPSVIAAAMDGSHERLDLVPNELWGPSPDGEALLVVDEDSAGFRRSEDAGDAGSVALDGLVLGEGAWAPDSSAVAAVGLGPGRSELVLL